MSLYDSLVEGSVSYSPSTHTVTFTPSAPLEWSGVYHVAVVGVRSAAGALSPPANWQFTTAVGGTIAGKVTDGASDAGLAGVTVVTDIGGYSATTDANGEYAIPGLPPGAYTMTAWKLGYGEEKGTAVVGAGDTVTVPLVLTAVPLTGTIAGQVTDAVTGQGISGVTITASPRGYIISTDGSGHYALEEVAPGPYGVTAGKSGYESASKDTTVAAGDTATVTYSLTAVAGPSNGGGGGAGGGGGGGGGCFVAAAAGIPAGYSAGLLFLLGLALAGGLRRSRVPSGT